MKRRNKKHGFDLQLTSLMDILIIIVIFLLKSYNTSTNSLTTSKNMELPFSDSKETPTDSLQLIITPEAISIDNERVIDFEQQANNLSSPANYALKASDLDQQNRRIIPLFDALMKSRSKTELLLTKSGPVDKPIEFPGILAITADKHVSYDTLRKVMYTAGTAGYKVFRFIALKRDS